MAINSEAPEDGEERNPLSDLADQDFVDVLRDRLADGGGLAFIDYEELVRRQADGFDVADYDEALAVLVEQEMAQARADMKEIADKFITQFNIHSGTLEKIAEAFGKIELPSFTIAPPLNLPVRQPPNIDVVDVAAHPVESVEPTSEQVVGYRTELNQFAAQMDEVVAHLAEIKKHTSDSADADVTRLEQAEHADKGTLTQDKAVLRLTKIEIGVAVIAIATAILIAWYVGRGST